MNKFTGDTHLKELLRGSGLSFLIKLFAMAISYLSILYITNIYGAKIYGTYVLALTIFGIFTIVPKFGMNVALVRIIGELYTKRNIVNLVHVVRVTILFVVVLAIVFSILLYALSSVIAGMFDKELLSFYLETLSYAIIPSVLIVISSASFQGMKMSATYMFFSVALLQVIFLVLLSINHVLEYDVSIIVLYVLSIMSTALISLYFLFKKKEIDVSTGNTVIIYRLKNIIPIAFPMLLSGSFFILMGWTDIIMLGMYESEENIGIYSVAQKIATLTSLSLIAINAIAAPKFIEFYSSHDLVGLEKIVKQSTKLILITSFPFLLFYVSFPGFIMKLFGEEFTKGVTVLVLLSMGQFINAISGSVGYLMQMTDNHKIHQNILIISSLINLILNYFLIPSYGINGAALATMTSMIIWNALLVIYIKQKLGFWTIYFPNIINLKRTKNDN